MKIIIAGCGKVGETLVTLLSAEGYDLTVIDKERAPLESIQNICDVFTLQGNCASMEILREAGVENADLLIASTDSDEVNLLSSATAHSLNKNLHTIARIRNPEYAGQIYKMRGIFSLSMVFNPERQAAQEIDALLKYPGFLKRDTFAKGRLEIVELKLEEGNPFIGASLFSLGERIKCRLLVCAVVRDGKAITPDGRFVLEEGDRIFVTAGSSDLSVLLRELDLVQKRAHNVMLVGGSRIAFYLAEILAARGVGVKLIERSPERCAELAETLPASVDIICADATAQTVLESEGIQRTDAIVALTDSDEMNVLLSLYANSVEVPQIITKLSHLDGGKVVDSLPLGSIVVPRKLCCNNIVRYVRATKQKTGAAVSLHLIADGEAEALEFIVDDTTRHTGEPLSKIRFKPGLLLAGIMREGKIEIPDGKSSFLPGDTVVVVSGSESVVLELNDVFAD